MGGPTTYYRVFINFGSVDTWIATLGPNLKDALGHLGLLMLTDFEEAESARDSAKRAGLVDGQFVIVPIFPVS